MSAKSSNSKAKGKQSSCYKSSKETARVTKTNYKMKQYMHRPKIRAKVDLSELSGGVKNTKNKTKKANLAIKTPRDISAKPLCQRARIKMSKKHDQFVIEDETHERVDKPDATETDSNDTLSIIYRHFNLKDSKNTSVNTSNAIDFIANIKRNSQTNQIENVLDMPKRTNFVSKNCTKSVKPILGGTFNNKNKYISYNDDYASPNSTIRDVEIDKIK